MQFNKTTVNSSVNILANDHFVAVPYDCSELTANANGVIPAGTIIPANDATAKGILLRDVKKDENPNGALVIHGFIEKSKLPVAPESDVYSALKGITFLNKGTVTTEPTYVYNEVPYVFGEVASPTGNPKTSGYYEKSGDDYVASTDTSVDAEKTYYTITSPTGNPKTQGFYEESGGVYSATNDTSVDASKTYYTRTTT